MKIYYAHSIRGQHHDGKWTALELVSYLQGLGHEVLSEEIWTTHTTLTDQEIYMRDTEMIRNCDIVLANVTNVSLGVGYELGYAEALRKKLLASTSQISLLVFLRGLVVIHYLMFMKLNQ